MLILSRKPGETIRIGDNILIRLLPDNEYGETCLGISAPPDVAIARDDARQREPRHRRHESSPGNR